MPALNVEHVQVFAQAKQSVFLKKKSTAYMYKRQPLGCLLSLFYLPYRIKKEPNNTCSYRVANRQISVHGIKIQAV